MRSRLRSAARPRAALLFAATLILGPATVARADHGFFLYEGLSGADRAWAELNPQSALETRQSQTRLSWRRTDGSWGGTVMLLRTFRVESNIYCLKFQKDVILDAGLCSATLTACRNGGGTWVTMEP